jgi:uncharacterized membrane protein
LSKARPILRIILALAMIAVGVMHFAAREVFEAIVPTWLPAHTVLVEVSGVFEILGGAGLLVPRTRVVAAYGLMALYIAVFPANINMAIHHQSIGSADMAPWLLWARLPLQAAFIAWAYWVRMD